MSNVHKALLVMAGDRLLLGRPDIHHLPGQTGRQVGQCAVQLSELSSDPVIQETPRGF